LETRERRRPTTSMPSASAWTTAYCLPRYSISFDARLAGGRRLRPVACRDLGAPQPHHMAALVSEAALLGTRSARQRLLEPPDRSMLRPAHDREVNRRVRFARRISPRGNRSRHSVRRQESAKVAPWPADRIA
jgi:hypothetical protein